MQKMEKIAITSVTQRALIGFFISCLRNVQPNRENACIGGAGGKTHAAT
jgi:hypothetical protein